MITRRTALSLLSLPLLPAQALAETSPPAQAGAPPPLAMVMNSGDATVSVIDMTSKQVINTLPMLREPSHWALTPDRKKLYVSDASGNALFIFDPLTAAPLGHIRIADPYQLAYTPDQKYLVVNALRLDYVDVYDSTTLHLVKRFKSGKFPSHLDFSPDSRFSFHSMQKSNTLVCLDLASMTERWSVPIGKTPAGVLWHNGKLLVCIMGENGIVEANPLTGQITRRQATGEGAHNIFLSPGGSTLYVSNRVGSTLSALDPLSLEVKRDYRIPGGPDDIGIAPDGKIWIALRFNEAVAVLDPLTGVFDTIPVGRSPHGIFLNTEMQKPGELTAERL
ncbi:YncE family protein [Acidocella sp.]|uniref:YncE family protein n=1 Tax=Acidocella sp. TaxID=50710 RepID=UPI00261773AB|nr:YncE family protein [Acidocella sp.]MDD2794698.1 YncE family protein [Acidocella sp.]